MRVRVHIITIIKQIYQIEGIQRNSKRRSNEWTDKVEEIKTKAENIQPGEPSEKRTRSTQPSRESFENDENLNGTHSLTNSLTEI